MSDGKRALKALMPGREITLPSGTKATVYPLGIRHLRRFTSAVGSIVAAVGDVQTRPGVSKEDLQKAVASQVVPVVMTDAIELVFECVRLDGETSPDDLPHWDLPALVDAWVDESFGDEAKVSPWKAALDNLKKRFGGGAERAMSAMGFKSSSPPATDSTTSSEETPGTHIQGGA